MQLTSRLQKIKSQGSTLKNTDDDIGRKYLLRLIEQEKKKILDPNMIYNLKILVEKMLTKMLLTHSIRVFYPMDATSNGCLSILKEGSVQNTCFFPSDLHNWYSS